jgi:hypothetical protein
LRYLDEYFCLPFYRHRYRHRRLDIRSSYSLCVLVFLHLGICGHIRGFFYWKSN